MGHQRYSERQRRDREPPSRLPAGLGMARCGSVFARSEVSQGKANAPAATRRLHCNAALHFLLSGNEWE